MVINSRLLSWWPCKGSDIIYLLLIFMLTENRLRISASPVPFVFLFMCSCYVESVFPWPVRSQGFPLHLVQFMKLPLWCNRDLGDDRQQRWKQGERDSRWVLKELGTGRQKVTSSVYTMDIMNRRGGLFRYGLHNSFTLKHKKWNITGHGWEKDKRETTCSILRFRTNSSLNPQNK